MQFLRRDPSIIDVNKKLKYNYLIHTFHQNFLSEFIIIFRKEQFGKLTRCKTAVAGSTENDSDETHEQKIERRKLEDLYRVYKVVIVEYE